MGLFQAAYQTYETHRARVGEYSEGRDPLAPCSHIVTRADLEITVDADGRFVSAAAVDKNESKIIIPVTEESAGRSSGPRAHPLCDQLQYLASYDEERYTRYVTQLRDWTNSAFTHPKLPPILRYVEGGSILSDLLAADLIEVDAAGHPKKPKLLVRWRVVGLGEEVSGPCWTDKSLFAAFEAYYRDKKRDEPSVLCMVTGEWDAPADMHPKGVVSINGNAKLISDNDKQNFTYRGRFTEPVQAETVSYEASQKAHNALRWLMAEQGELVAGRAFLCWSPQGVTLPRPTGPFLHKQNEPAPPTPSDYQKQLHETLKGWLTSLPTEQTEAVIASFDAATSGRLSVLYYRELAASDFLQRLYDWDTSCCWINRGFGVQAPSLRRIVNCAYGTQRNGNGGVRMEADERMARQQIQRLLTCRVERAAIPSELVRQLAQRASARHVYDASVYEQILFTACAVIRKYDRDRKKEEWSMALEPQKRNRSYQYGRLLAVLEKAELDTYDKGEKRQPNAVRLQEVFSRRPQYAARLIWERVRTAYLPRLKPGIRAWYERLLGEIMEQLSVYADAELNRPLDDAYLMGYYLQREALYMKKDEKTEENEHGNSEE